jgi:EpsI family protein
MSLIALAIAFAFFIRTSPLKRFVLVGSAVPVAILTNALRVIVTGLLAQTWGAKAATGFFHEFAGMVVFVLAMAILAGIGALLKEEEPEPEGAETEAQPGPAGATPQSASFRLRFLAVSVLFALAGCYQLFHADLQVPLNRSFSSFPLVVGEWQMTTQDTFSSQILEVLKPTDYLSRTYTDRNGIRVQLYVGYHGGGKESGEIHSPRHCLPGSGWQELASTRIDIDSQGGKVSLVKAVYSQGDRKEHFFYWFQVRDRTIDDEYSLKLAGISNSVLYRRRDASFIRIKISEEAGIQDPAAVGLRFVKDFYPVIREFLPK